jgi:hypothetical protein
VVAAIAGCAAAGASSPQTVAPPTTVVRFVVPTQLPELMPYAQGRCGASNAAWFRDDARRCAVGADSLDPCFTTPAAGIVLCNPDPRKAGSGQLISVTMSAASPAPVAEIRHLAWFFELADGTTCRPLAGGGREWEDLIELYTCRFGSDGQADAVLGDLDDSGPIWTIRKVLINKKSEPQTIKSIVMAPVKAVWK